ncbi:MAG: hypothetical protein PHY08_10610 [Candidatus Cloacimonetes bacterium]|nr:hypothetical protein [Candidatus Cloacimonadota bacterium]
MFFDTIYYDITPVMRADPSGCFWDTILDIGFTIWSLVDFIKNPTWENAGWLAVDLVFLAIPFIPGIGKGTKAITKIDDVQDIASMMNRGQDVVVIGQSMTKRVIPYADNIGALYYKGFSHYNDVAKVSKHLANGIGYVDNTAYIAEKSLTGAKFIDLGWDIARIGEKGLWWSKFTIYSERFIAETFRIQKLIRFGQHIYF